MNVWRGIGAAAVFDVFLARHGTSVRGKYPKFRVFRKMAVVSSDAEIVAHVRRVCERMLESCLWHMYLSEELKDFSETFKYAG